MCIKSIYINIINKLLVLKVLPIELPIGLPVGSYPIVCASEKVEASGLVLPTFFSLCVH